MNDDNKEICNPYSSGGGGVHFEAYVQASFVTLMLAGGYAPCLPQRPICKIKLQAKYAGYQTDDLIVFAQDCGNKEFCKLLGQIKHTISITKSDPTFSEVIRAAWNDFNNPKVFTKGKDVIALITGPLSATDINDVRIILEWARHTETSTEYFQNVELAHFSSDSKLRKLQAFKANLKKANHGKDVADAEIFEFLRHFHLLGYDLDIKAGVTLALLHSLIGQYSPEDVHSIWVKIVDEVQIANKNAGTISVSSISEDISSAFKQRQIETIPAELAKPDIPPNPGSNQEQIKALTAAALLGKWDENSVSDIDIIKRLIDGI